MVGAGPAQMQDAHVAPCGRPGVAQPSQQAGLEVTSAHVQTRGEFAREQQQRQQANDDGAAAAAAAGKAATTDLPRATTIGGSGLDFWA